jgi:hypothetical protein
MRAGRQSDRLSTIAIGLLFTNFAVGIGLYFRERGRASVSDQDFFERLEAAKDETQE